MAEKIMLIDVDSKIPNLALMKIANYHKKKGDLVSWKFNKPDKIYISVIFPENKYKALASSFYFNCDIMIGGTGYDPSIQLPKEIDETSPDYSIYPNFKDSLGRVTIGCIRNCSFCLVPKMGKIRYIQPVKDFYRGGTCRILDDNILAHKDAWDETADYLIKNKIPTFFDALDIRLVNEENSKQLTQIKHDGSIHFAFDYTHYETQLRNGIELMIKAGCRPNKMMFYIYLDSEKEIEDAKYRWKVIRSYNCEPFLMVNKINLTKKLKKIRRRGCRPAIWRNLTADEIFAG